MATQFSANFPIPSASNGFAMIWKLTRTMKAAGWTYKASGAGPTAGPKDTTGTASNDIWGTNTTPLSDTYTNTSTVTTSGIVGGVLSVSSTTGFAAGGGTISILTTTNGWQNFTYSTTSGSTFTGVTGTGTVITGLPVANGSNTYGLDQVAAWIVMSGPQTQKIPISAIPTGTPVRGEIITQATSSATGELLGYVWDPISSSGWMAVLPQTGTFNNTNTITGNSSGATFTPTGIVTTFYREIMFYKDTSQTQGTIYYGCFDGFLESTQFFSYLATQTGCVANVGPGMGGTNNTFPARGILVIGTSNSTTTGSWLTTTSQLGANSQIAATNCTPSAGVSADGSFYLVFSNSTTTTYTAGFAFLRVDDSEPGDCDPFVFCTPCNTNVFTTVTNTTVSSSAGGTFSLGHLMAYSATSSYPYFYGYQSRGNGYLDTFNAYTGILQNSSNNSNNIAPYASYNQSNTKINIINSPATAKPTVLEPLSLFTYGCASVPNSKPQYKGRLRWMFATALGNAIDTYQNKTVLVLCSSTSNTTPAFAIGPYNGSTTPSL